jgi:glycosyltransferase involved in cell wall biosynthesis
MRIAHLTPYFPPHVGGTETLVSEIASWQSKLGHSVIVLTSHSPTEAPLNETTSNGVDVLRLPTKEILERPVCWGIGNALSRIGRLDVINLWTPFPMADIAAFRYARKRAVPLVTTYVMDAIMNDVLGSRLLARAGTRLYNQFQTSLVVKKSRLVISLNRTYARKSRFLSQVPEDKIRISYQGTNIDRFLPRDSDYGPLKQFKSAGNVIILALGRLVSYKGLDILIRAFKEASESREDMYLAIGGEGPLDGALMKLTRSLNLVDKIGFLGYVPDQDLVDLINTSDIVVSSAVSDLENVPIVILDAMACGKPVIATDVGGAREQVENKRVGIIVPPKRIDKLAEAMERLIDDKGLREEYGRQARKYAESISWSEIAKGTLRIYQEAIQTVRQ